MLAPGHSFMLIEDARRAEQLAGELATSIQRLAALPGNLALDADAVHDAITAALAAGDQRRADRDLVLRKSRRLRSRVREWNRLHATPPQVSPRLAADLSALAQRVRAMVAARPQPDPSAPALRDAADALARSAGRIRVERHRAGHEAIAALDRVARLAAEVPTTPSSVLARATARLDQPTWTRTSP